MEAMRDGELAVLFRNNHFHTIHKRKIVAMYGNLILCGSLSIQWTAVHYFSMVTLRLALSLLAMSAIRKQLVLLKRS
ncbi:unnamed protein product [Cylicostephanus goldi]|uniref:MINDY deubiquitinase domain-containing protein n=1 Tax=Cylicostephanus goldi TaxID=71465 RepID=A0A3P7NJ29_CYLGO|nr:unnamed protein product [Cylicostephanus goldi]